MTFEDWDDLDDSGMTCQWLCKEFEMTFGKLLEWLQMILEWLQMTLGWHSDDFVMSLPTAFKSCFLSYSILWRRHNFEKISLVVLTLLTLSNKRTFFIFLCYEAFFRKFRPYVLICLFLGGARLLGRSE